MKESSHSGPVKPFRQTHKLGLWHSPPFWHPPAHTGWHSGALVELVTIMAPLGLLKNHFPKVQTKLTDVSPGGKAYPRKHSASPTVVLREGGARCYYHYAHYRG